VRILGDDELAADATQKAFIKAYRSIKSYRGGSFKAAHCDAFETLLDYTELNRVQDVNPLQNLIW
jgi:Sigma-70 region 2